MQFRHGDVMLERVDELPPSPKPLPHTILAHGEVTGHSHRIAEASAARLFHTSAGLYLHVTAPKATLVHQEHHDIELPAGYYRVWRQREYTPEEIRIVRD